MKTRKSNTLSHTLSAIALVLTTFIAGTASAAVFKADFNRDGYEDLVVGSPFEDVGSIPNVGAISVLYGSAGSLPRFPSQQWYQDSPGIAGASEASDGFGAAVAVGDFNRDGYDDVAIGVAGEDVGGVGPDGNGKNAGVVNVIYGSGAGLHAQGNQMLSLATLDSGLAQAEAFFGGALTTGDFNGDGYADLAVGILSWDRGTITSTGAVAVFFGGSQGFVDQRGTLIYQGQPRVPITSEVGDNFGDSLAAADFDRDGYADLAIGIPREAIGSIGFAGAVVVVYGAANSEGFHPSRSHVLTDIGNGAAVETGDQFGRALTAGDFNGDGIADLAIGVPFDNQERTLAFDRDSTGQVTVLYGSRNGMIVNSRSYWHQDQPNVASERGEADYFGWALSVGDFNRDNRADLVVGVPGKGVYADDEGSVHVFYGTTAGLSAGPALGRQLISEVLGSQEQGDQFGDVLP